jgi:thiamine monophosphate synthase
LLFTITYFLIDVVASCYAVKGPIFATQTKDVKFFPQGVSTVAQLRRLIPEHLPFVTIGGINDAQKAALVREAGSDSIAVIAAITSLGIENKDAIQETVTELRVRMEAE